MEQAKIIQGYHARLDPFALGIGLVLYVEISLARGQATARTHFESFVAALPQVVEISDVSGDIDYIFKVVVADMAEWNRLREQLTAGSLGVDRVTAHVLVRKPKVFVGYPVPDR